MNDSLQRKWRPVEPLQNWSDLHNPGTEALANAWQEQAGELREQDAYRTFVDKLRREWAIETGVIERLYEISGSATKVLIEHGLDESYLSSSDTDRPVEHVIAMLRDQESAIESMYRFVADQRSLTTGYIKELHAVLTTHQTTTDSVDASGRHREVSLLRGAWRTTEAQVTDSNGTTWLYCQPSLLESQMLDLLEMHDEHERLGLPTEIKAAWLHHQFTLIHPFQDGNGRVARCLATLIMLKSGWFPLVVTRTDKSRYIQSLRAADDLDLKPLVECFSDLQKRSIRKALSLSESVISERKTIASYLETAKHRLIDRQKNLQKQHLKSHTVAETLRLRAADRLKAVAAESTTMLQSLSTSYKAIFDQASDDDERSFYYKKQVVDYAISNDYFANTREYRAWAIMAMITDVRTEIIIHFHGIGHDSRGVLCCAPIFCTKDAAGNIDSVTALSDSPFEFSYIDDPYEVSSRFTEWLDTVVGEGIRKWSEGI